MEIVWGSRKGKERRKNNDALALWLTSEGMAACIVDGAERYGLGDGIEKKSLACYWAESLVEEVRLLGLDCSNQEIHNMLHQLHGGLRPTYIKEIASYQLLIIDSDGLLRVFHVGDCRLGVGAEGGINWITQPHRLVDELPDTHGLDEYDIENAASCLVRSLNARRFFAPDFVGMSLDFGKPLLLSTDGYWHEVLSKCVAQYGAGDDSSYLILTPSFQGFGAWSVRNLSDSQNIYLDYRSSPQG